MVIQWIFWFFFIPILYCYFGYPLFLSIIAVFRAPSIAHSDETPAVSIVLSVWNEEDCITEKIKNLLSLDYPREKIEIIIGSDGSTDGTNAIIGQYADQGIRFVESQQRQGKMLTINTLVKTANNEIIIFTDARQLFEKNVVKELVKNFADERIGCVSGELIFSKKEDATSKGVNLYWSYEKFIRRKESKIHSMLGATGAIYAIRKDLYTEVPKDVVLDDMFIPLKIIEKGYRAIFDDSAKAYDEVADSPREEHRRKARTLYGNYQIFTLLPQMFNIVKSPVALQLFSHKFLRLLIPFFMIGLLIVNILMLDGAFYKYFFILQATFYIMAMLGALTRYSNHGILKLIARICYVPYVFCLLNFSALVGFVRFITAKQEVTWQKARG